MKVVIASQGLDMSSPIDLRFARANYFLLVDTDSAEITAIVDNQHTDLLHEAWDQAAHTVVMLGAEALISSNVGPKAFDILSAGGVCICTGADGTVAEALKQFKAGKLETVDRANVEQHCV